MEPNQIIDYWKIVEVTKQNIFCLCIACNQPTIHKFTQAKLRSRVKKCCGCLSSSELRKRFYQKKYGVDNVSQLKAIKEKKVQKAQDKYGVDNPSQAKVIKDKKIKTTNKNFGVDHPMQSKTIMQKSKGTIKEKYGVDHISQLDEIKERKKDSFVLNSEESESKREATCQLLYGNVQPFKSQKFKEESLAKIQAKYGVDNPSQAVEIKNKKIQNSQIKYGTNHPQSSKGLKDKSKISRTLDGTAALLSTGEYLSDLCDQKGIANKSHAYNLLRRFGEKDVLNYVNNYNNENKDSELESLFISLMKDYFPEISKYNKFPLEDRSIARKPDFRLEKNGKVLYINTDGLYYHSELCLANDYHYDLYDRFKSSNLRMMQFRWDEVRDKGDIVRSMILNYFGEHEKKLAARKCIIKLVGKIESKEFLSKNHLMGVCTSSTNYGLYFENQLVSLMCIQNKEERVEIIRFGTKNNIAVRGGFSKLLAHVVKIHKAKIINSFCDLRYASGQSYYKLKFVNKGRTKSWMWTDLIHTFNRLKCRANMDDRGLTQEEQAKEFKWYKIYDAGQVKFELELLK